MCREHALVTEREAELLHCLVLQMDVWALGVCIYMWAFGELPFTGAAPFIIYNKIRSEVRRIAVFGINKTHV